MIMVPSNITGKNHTTGVNITLLIQVSGVRSCSPLARQVVPPTGMPAVPLGVPVALDGSAASVGTLGRWLVDESDLVTTRPADAEASTELHLGFPRNWPAVFKQNATLKGLINHELRGTRCRAVAMPPSGADASKGKAAAVGCMPMHSFSNAEKIVVALPEWKVVKGFAIFEQLSEGAGSSFIAIRHWWNATPSDTWLDFTPPLAPASTVGKVLLVESSRGDKAEAPLRGTGQTFAIVLAQRLAVPNGAVGEEATQAPTAGPPVPMPLTSPPGAALCANLAPTGYVADGHSDAADSGACDAPLAFADSSHGVTDGGFDAVAVPAAQPATSKPAAASLVEQEGEGESGPTETNPGVEARQVAHACQHRRLSPVVHRSALLPCALASLIWCLMC